MVILQPPANSWNFSSILTPTWSYYTSRETGDFRAILGDLLGTPFVQDFDGFDLLGRILNPWATTPIPASIYDNLNGWSSKAWNLLLGVKTALKWWSEIEYHLHILRALLGVIVPERDELLGEPRGTCFSAKSCPHSTLCLVDLEAGGTLSSAS